VSLFDGGDEYIDSDPDLRLDCTLRGAEKRLDVQVLFYLFEKQLDLPTVAIEFGEGQRRQSEIVGQKTNCLLVLAS
jgi:hypothetical protein